MSHGNRPHAGELLDAVRQALAGLAPQVSGAQGYELRVAAKALEILSRELAMGAEAAAAERGRLRVILGEDGPLEALNAELCRRLRDGRQGFDDPKLLAALREGVRARLAIDNPQFVVLSR